MAQVLLHIPKEVHQAVWTQLLPRHLRSEEAGFMYVSHRPQDEAEVFEYVDWYPIPSNGFLHRSRYHFELTDETRLGLSSKLTILEPHLSSSIPTPDAGQLPSQPVTYLASKSSCLTSGGDSKVSHTLH